MFILPIPLQIHSFTPFSHLHPSLSCSLSDFLPRLSLSPTVQNLQVLSPLYNFLKMILQILWCHLETSRSFDINDYCSDNCIHLFPSLQLNHQNKCWKCTCLPTMDCLNSHLFMLHFYISFGSIINYLLWQCHAYALVRYSQKNNVVSFRKRSCFCLKYLVKSLQIQLEMGQRLGKK